MIDHIIDRPQAEVIHLLLRDDADRLRRFARSELKPRRGRGHARRIGSGAFSSAGIARRHPVHIDRIERDRAGRRGSGRDGSGIGDGHGVGAGEAEGQARSSQQAAERLIARQRPCQTGAAPSGNEIGRKQQSQSRPVGECVERPAEILRRDIKGDRLRRALLRRNRLRVRGFEERCAGQERQDRRRSQQNVPECRYRTCATPALFCPTHNVMPTCPNPDVRVSGNTASAPSLGNKDETADETLQRIRSKKPDGRFGRKHSDDPSWPGLSRPSTSLSR